MRLTPPVVNTTLFFVLAIFGFIFLTVSVLLFRSWTAFGIGVGIYIMVVIIAMLINKYLRKVAKRDITDQDA